MKIRGNTVGTPIKPKKVLVKCDGLTEEEKAQIREKLGITDGTSVFAVGDSEFAAMEEYRLFHTGDVYIITDGVRCGDVYLATSPESAQLQGNISGADGISPTATVEETAEGAKITITDKNGTTTATVKNGKDGTGGGGSADVSTLEKDIAELQEMVYVSKNLYDVAAITEGQALDITQDTGAVSSTVNAETHAYSDWISVEAGESYFLSNKDDVSASCRVHFADENGVLVADSSTVFSDKGGNTVGLLVAPENAVKFRFSSTITNMKLPTLMLEKGTSASEFEPYAKHIKEEYLPKIHAIVDFSGVEEYEPLLEVIDENVEKSAVALENNIFQLGKNLFDESKVTTGTILKMPLSSGNVSTSSANDSFSTSDWISVEAGESYRLHYSGGTLAFRLHIADADGVLVADSIGQQPAQVIVIPSGAAKVRFSNKTEVMQGSNLQFEKGATPTDYEPYSKHIKDEYLLKDYVWKGKKAVFNGDSILELPYNWGKQMCAELGMIYHENKAIGGSTLCEYGGTAAEAPRDRTPLISRYQQMTTDADIVFISIGTNDWCYSWADVGTDTDTVNTTFKGALHSMIKGMLDIYIGKPIIFVTPIKRNEPNGANGFGKTLKDYADAIIDVCGQYGIPVLDMFRTCPLNPSITTQQEQFFDGNKNTEAGYTLLYDDTTHPNYYGARVQARCAIGFMKSQYIFD